MGWAAWAGLVLLSADGVQTLASRESALNLRSGDVADSATTLSKATVPTSPHSPCNNRTMTSSALMTIRSTPAGTGGALCSNLATFSACSATYIAPSASVARTALA